MIETKIDEMVGISMDEISSFISCKALRNPVMQIVCADIILFILTAPILFGLLCVSIACREIEARRS